MDSSHAALDGDGAAPARERGRLAVGDEVHALSEGGSQYSGRSHTRSPSAHSTGLSPLAKVPSHEPPHEPSGRHEAPLGVPSRNPSTDSRQTPAELDTAVSELAIDAEPKEPKEPKEPSERSEPSEPSRASTRSGSSTAGSSAAEPVARAAATVAAAAPGVTVASAATAARKAPTASFGIGGTPLNAPRANMAIDAQKVAAVDAADADGMQLLTQGHSSADAALAAAAAAAREIASTGEFKVRERLALQPEPHPQTAPSSRDQSRESSRQASLAPGAAAAAVAAAAGAGAAGAAGGVGAAGSGISVPTRSASEPEPASEPVEDPATITPVARECGYVLGRELGKGTYSTVRECTHKETNKRYAAKIINKRLMRGREFLVRNEIVVLRRVSKNHPSILTLVDYFETASNLYLITELARGGELFDRIYSHGSFYESDAAKVIKEVTSGVAHLHKNGIVHRDLKPENLLYKTSSDHSRLLIADFGLSRIVDEERFRMLTTTCGTPSYMAPEIFSKDGHGKPVDIWAIGVITYFLLSGFVPFDRDNPAEEREAILKGEYKFEPAEYWIHVSRDALSFINACLCRKPEDRMTAEQCLQHPFLTKRYRRETDLVPGEKRSTRRSSTLEIPSTLEGEAMNGAYSSSPVVKDRVMGRWG